MRESRSSVRRRRKVRTAFLVFPLRIPAPDSLAAIDIVGPLFEQRSQTSTQWLKRRSEAASASLEFPIKKAAERAREALHKGIGDHNNYLVNVLELPKMHCQPFRHPYWVILVKKFWKILLYLVPALAGRTKTSFSEEIMKNVTFWVLLHCDLGWSYYEKWLQYQMLGAKKGPKWWNKLNTIITYFLSYWVDLRSILT